MWFRCSFYSTGYFTSHVTSTINFNDLDKISWECHLVKFAWVVDCCQSQKKLLLGKHERHTELTSYRLSLNLIISGTPHISKLVFWIYKSQHLVSETVMKLFSFLIYLALKFLEKRMIRMIRIDMVDKDDMIDKDDTNFLI